MSGGKACRCDNPQWRVIQRHCNHSAFSGYHYTPSAYSSVFCMSCDAHWRTKADYVARLPDATNQDLLRIGEP
jgi:hypothetical protein